MRETKLGQLVTEPSGRDAVHIAVVPTIARRRLSPGQRVDKNGDVIDKLIGIVDPWLKVAVLEGQTFLLCIDPGTITGLRHVWMHPEFQKGPS